METIYDVLKTAVDICALEKTRGISLQRGLILFDDQLTPYQKVSEISVVLQRLGYRLLKTKGYAPKQKSDN